MTVATAWPTSCWSSAGLIGRATASIGLVLAGASV